MSMETVDGLVAPSVSGAWKCMVKYKFNPLVLLMEQAWSERSWRFTHLKTTVWE